MKKILIIEDEKAINDLIKMNLKLVGYECFQAFDSDGAEKIIGKISPDLILLDVMIPGKDGFTLMQEDVFNNIPVIYVTAKGNINDRVRGLKLGADDYIVKPFEAVELIARVEAVLRRSGGVQSVFQIDDTVINLDEYTVIVNGKNVSLTNREFELLKVLISNRNIALSREKLLNLAWGYDYDGDIRTVDVYITKLRKKLELEKYIKTVYKLGYRLEVPN